MVALSRVMLGCLGISLAGLMACETTCSVEGDRFPEKVEDGITDLENGTYETTPWDGEYHHFPPKKRYEFWHGLGGRPLLVTTYVGFVKVPIGDAPFGNISESAGNIVIIEAVTSDYIRVRNDTCETFYLRVFAGNPERSASISARGAGGGSG